MYSLYADANLKNIFIRAIYIMWIHMYIQWCNESLFVLISAIEEGYLKNSLISLRFITIKNEIFYYLKVNLTKIQHYFFVFFNRNM